MWQNYIENSLEDTSTYGLGWRSPTTNPRHSGKHPGARNRLKLFIQDGKKDAIIILTNTEVQNKNEDDGYYGGKEFIVILRDRLKEEFLGEDD